MSDLFQNLTAGFSRFVLAWLVPSMATVSLFAIFLYPHVSHSSLLVPVERVTRAGKLDGAVVFALGTLLLSLLFALTSLPLNRLLEGYTLPPSLRRYLLAKEVRRLARLRMLYLNTPRRFVAFRGQIKEQIDLYPTNRAQIMPTRLGNAWKAAETYGSRQFSLDGQTFYYELQGVVPGTVRKDLEDARAQVDFFIAFVGQLGLLSIVSLVVAVSSAFAPAIILAIVCTISARLAYMAAVKNMTDVRYALQALVNVGRPGLAEALGYRLPTTLSRERELWAAWMRFITQQQPSELEELDSERAGVANERD